MIRPCLYGLLFALAGCLCLTACNKNTPVGVNAQTSTVGFILSSASSATVFESAVVRSQLDSVFVQPGPFTVFVPNDDAFRNSGISMATLDAYSDSAIKAFVLYHTIAGTSLTLTNLQFARTLKIIMANGDSAYITTDTTHFFINGIPAEATDVIASNGVIHAIEQVLIPPSQNMLQRIQSDSSLTLMAAAIHRASETGIAFDTLLNSSGPYTVLAPVNSAFNAANYFTPNDIEAANADSMAYLVNSHIISSRNFACDFGAPTKYNLNDSSLTFSNNGFNYQVQVTGGDSLSLANVTTTNLLVRNGVLFKIDLLLK